MADIHPIRGASDYERALAEIGALIKQNPDGTTVKPAFILPHSGSRSMRD